MGASCRQGETPVACDSFVCLKEETMLTATAKVPLPLT